MTDTAMNNFGTLIDKDTIPKVLLGGPEIRRLVEHLLQQEQAQPNPSPERIAALEAVCELSFDHYGTTNIIAEPVVHSV